MTSKNLILHYYRHMIHSMMTLTK